MREEIVEEQRAGAFFGAPLAEREQAGEPRPAGAVLRIGENVRGRVGEDEPRADGERDAMLLRRLVRAHDARDRIAVGDAKAREPESACLHHQFLGMRRPPQEGEIGGDGELGIGGQSAPLPDRCRL